jgi:hypothetical protein
MFNEGRSSAAWWASGVYGRVRAAWKLIRLGATQVRLLSSSPD